MRRITSASSAAACRSAVLRCSSNGASVASSAAETASTCCSTFAKADSRDIVIQFAIEFKSGGSADLLGLTARAGQDFLGVGEHLVGNGFCIYREGAFFYCCANGLDLACIEIAGGAGGLIQCPDCAGDRDRHTGG